jgi:hypothetical protein
MLGEFGSADEPPPFDAVLGAAAVVARSDPRALLPDVSAVVANPQAVDGVDRDIFAALPVLVSASSEVLHEFGESAIAGMVRWLWFDCATFDLMTFADIVGMQVEQSGCEDPMVGLFVDLAEQVTATAEQKRYVVQRFEAAGASPAAIERLKLAWRATLVAPERGEVGPDALPSADPEPPLPEPRVDESLAMFDADDERGVEIARVMLEQMFEANQPSPAIVYWLMVTVDAMPARRRRRDVGWALTVLGSASRRASGSLPGVLPSVLQRWLDAPQLLSPLSTLIALELLSARQPSLVVRGYIHRAIALSDVRHAEIQVGRIWRAVVEAEPGIVLMIVSRWLAFSFDRCDFIALLINLLAAESRADPALLARLERGLVQTERTPAVVIEVARSALQQLRDERRGADRP